MTEVIKITDEQAGVYLATTHMLRQLGAPEVVAAPYIVMVKGYGEDWDEYNELTVDDLENDNVVDAGYEDYQLWLNDTLTNVFKETN